VHQITVAHRCLRGRDGRFDPLAAVLAAGVAGLELPVVAGAYLNTSHEQNPMPSSGIHANPSQPGPTGFLPLRSPGQMPKTSLNHWLAMRLALAEPTCLRNWRYSAVHGWGLVAHFARPSPLVQ